MENQKKIYLNKNEVTVNARYKIGGVGFMLVSHKHMFSNKQFSPMSPHNDVWKSDCGDYILYHKER